MTNSQFPNLTPKIVLVLTPIAHIPLVEQELGKIGELQFELSGNPLRVARAVEFADYIFTNPNKNSVVLGPETLGIARKLKAICTASTGLTHIDQDYLKEKGIDLLSLREERSLLAHLPSTAELAAGLTLLGLRNLSPAIESTRDGDWNYEPYIGRQLGGMTVGVVGLGRLGAMFAKYMLGFGATVGFFDPNVPAREGLRKHMTLESLISESDVLSLHAHVNESSTGMISSSSLQGAKPNVVIVNTARGELVDEVALLDFLQRNQDAKYIADVISHEHQGLRSSPLFPKLGSQILLTPHVGGMTIEGQRRAFLHAAKLLTTYEAQLQ